MSDPPKVSEGFYGTGESMLFTFKDNKIKVNLFYFQLIFFIIGIGGISENFIPDHVFS